jgi:alginate O-acetyltransferase complex protein AlgJ
LLDDVLQSYSFPRHRVLSYLSALLFLTLLALPTVDQYYDISPKFLVAEAPTPPLPALTANPVSWGRAFDVLRRSFLEHHYGFRDLLISANNYLDTFVLDSSTPSSQVLVGRDGWLFLSREGSGRDILEEFRSSAHLPEAPLADIARALEWRREWLAARGIRYLVVLAPNKNTVYPEKLPKNLVPADPGHHLRELDTYLRRHTTVELLDMTPVLLERKKTEQVFYATDSHWNANGAFAAYQALMTVLKREFPAIVPLDRRRFEVESYKWVSGDLPFMMGLSKFFPEKRIIYRNKDWYKARGKSYDGPMEPWFTTMPQASFSDNAALPRVVVLHDSFWWEMIPFVGESFSEALYAWCLPASTKAFRHFDEALITRFHPDIVIEEFTERFITPSLDEGAQAKADTKKK